MHYYDLGNKLKEKRKQKQLTQKDLASLAGISRQTLSKLENGIFGSGVSLISFIKVLESLEMEFDIDDKKAFDFDL